MDGSTIFMIIMGVLLVALIGVFLYLRKQRSDE
jgi:LPXTG-motif cell wall-anchored protein